MSAAPTLSPVPTLPAAFSALQPFVTQWGGRSLSQRDTARLESTPAGRQAFYDAAGALAPAALDYLDRQPLDRLDDGDRALMNMMLSLIHVALAVELQGADEHIHARGAAMMPIVRGHADPA